MSKNVFNRTSERARRLAHVATTHRHLRVDLSSGTKVRIAAASHTSLLQGQFLILRGRWRIQFKK